MYLDKYSACLTDEQTSKLFEITDENGKTLRYTGILIKRKFDKSDFVKLEPRENLQATIVLNKWYEFYNASHTYSVSYQAFNHSFEEEEMFKMTSNKTIVTYPK